MTNRPRPWPVAVACCVLLAACSGARGVPATRHALERVGYREVDVSFRSGGGIDLVRVDAVAATGDLEPGAAAVWATLPLRFDRLHLSVDAPDRAAGATFTYEQLTALFGPRAPGLDRRQVGDEVVESGLKLVVLLSAGALLSVGLVVGLTLFAVGKVRRRRRSPAREDDQDDWDGSFPGLDNDSPAEGASPTAGASEGPDAMPS